MPPRNEETVSTRFILTIFMVLACFFYIHSGLERSELGKSVTLKQFIETNEEISGTSETDFYPTVSTTASVSTIAK